MTPARCAGTGAVFALAGSLYTLVFALAADTSTHWAATALFVPLWAGLLLAVAATGRWVRSLSVVAATLLVLQYAVVEFAFSGWQWMHAVLALPVVAFAAAGAVPRPSPVAPQRVAS
jgi:hypothetical protein